MLRPADKSVLAPEIAVERAVDGAPFEGHEGQRWRRRYLLKSPCAPAPIPLGRRPPEAALITRGIARLRSAMISQAPPSPVSRAPGAPWSTVVLAVMARHLVGRQDRKHRLRPRAGCRNPRHLLLRRRAHARRPRRVDLYAPVVKEHRELFCSKVETVAGAFPGYTLFRQGSPGPAATSGPRSRCLPRRGRATARGVPNLGCWPCGAGDVLRLPDRTGSLNRSFDRGRRAAGSAAMKIGKSSTVLGSGKRRITHARRSARDMLRQAIATKRRNGRLFPHT